METIKQYLSILLTLSMMMCCISSGFTVNAAPTAKEEMIVIEVEEGIVVENELQPMAAAGCQKDPLETYFGQGYIITSRDDAWIYIEGTNGYSGAYDFTTGYGYQINDDGSHTGFQIQL